MNKYIRVTFENKEVWDIPASLIANKIAEKEMYEMGDDYNIDTEYEYIMDDDYELIRFLSENMEWKSLEVYSYRVIFGESYKDKLDSWEGCEFDIVLY